jgi:hypothetical protein
MHSDIDAQLTNFFEEAGGSCVITAVWALHLAGVS